LISRAPPSIRIPIRIPTSLRFYNKRSVVPRTSERLYQTRSREETLRRRASPGNSPRALPGASARRFALEILAPRGSARIYNEGRTRTHLWMQIRAEMQLLVLTLGISALADFRYCAL